MGKASKYPTAPRQTGKWNYTINNQKLTGAEKTSNVRIAAMSPSVARNSKAEKLHTRAVKLSKPGYRDF